MLILDEHDSVMSTAVKNKDYHIIQTLLRSKTDINAACYKKDPPIIVAAQYCELSMTKFLIEFGAEIPATAHDKPILHFMDREYSYDYIEWLDMMRICFENGCERYINVTDKSGTTVLLQHMKSVESIATVSMLLDHQADPNIADTTGLTPLMHACLHNTGTGAVPLLLQHNANALARDRSGRSAFYYALSAYTGASVAGTLLQLIAAGLPAERGPHGSSALHWLATVPAANFGAGETKWGELAGDSGRIKESLEDVLGLLLDAGAGASGGPSGVGDGVDVLDSHNFTPLMRAAEAGNAAVARLLLERRADVTVRDVTGRSLLILAQASASASVFANRAYGGSRDARDMDLERAEVVKVLVEAVTRRGNIDQE
jgi:ankyrin repeat protein